MSKVDRMNEAMVLLFHSSGEALSFRFVRKVKMASGDNKIVEVGHLGRVQSGVPRPAPVLYGKFPFVVPPASCSWERRRMCEVRLKVETMLA